MPILSTARLIVWGVAAVAAIGAGLYIRNTYIKAGKYEEAQQEISELRDLLIKAADNDKRNREAAQKALQQEADLQKRLASANDRSAALGERLRAALKAQPCLPDPSADSPIAAGASGDRERDSGTVDVPRTTGLIDIINKVIAAGQRDGTRLNEWIALYNALDPRLKYAPALKIEPAPPL